MTRKLPSGKDLGYLVPHDAEMERFQTRSISMTQLDEFSVNHAKHVYCIMDSCYGGLAMLTRSGTSRSSDQNWLANITKRHARQILTAGGADQRVVDGGAGGHSMFTSVYVLGLEAMLTKTRMDILLHRS